MKTQATADHFSDKLILLRMFRQENRWCVSILVDQERLVFPSLDKAFVFLSQQLVAPEADIVPEKHASTQ